MTPRDATGSPTPGTASGPPGLAEVVDLVPALAAGPARRSPAARPRPAGLPALGDVTALAADGPCLVVATGLEGCLQVVVPGDRSGPRVVLGAHGARVTALLAAQGRVVSGGCDGRVLVWRTGAPATPGVAWPVVVGRHRAGVTAVVPAAGARLVTAGHDGYLLTWQGPVPRVLGAHRGGVEAAIAPAPDLIVTAGRDGRLLARRTTGEDTEVELRQRRREITPALAVTGDGRLVTASGHRGVVRLWRELDGDADDGGWFDELGIHRGWVLALVVLGDRVAAVGGGSVTLWDLRSGTETRIPLDRGLHATTAALLAPGGLAVCGGDGQFQLLDLAVPAPAPGLGRPA